MICVECRNGNPHACWGKTRDKTWCDNQHKGTPKERDTGDEQENGSVSGTTEQQ